MGRRFRKHEYGRDRTQLVSPILSIKFDVSIYAGHMWKWASKWPKARSYIARGWEVRSKAVRSKAKEGRSYTTKNPYFCRWLNQPFWKYASHIGSFPGKIRVKYQNIFEPHLVKVERKTRCFPTWKYLQIMFLFFPKTRCSLLENYHQQTHRPLYSGPLRRFIRKDVSSWNVKTLDRFNQL